MNIKTTIVHWCSLAVVYGMLLLCPAILILSGCSGNGHSVNDVFEDFDNNSADGFSSNPYFSLANGQFQFSGDHSDNLTWTTWNGGSSPSNRWYASPGDSNYFDRFHLSVDTYFIDGDPSHVYGLIFCIRDTGHISFYISNDSFYLITQTINGQEETLVDWTKTFLLAPSDPHNTLAVDKAGDQYRFRINDTEVELLTIPGHDGGGIGLLSSLRVDIAFDNFTLTEPMKIVSDYNLTANQNLFVYHALQSSYYWADLIPPIDYTDFSSPNDLLTALIYKAKDHWSYIVDKATYHNYFEAGQYIGLGLNAHLESPDIFRVQSINSNSPAQMAGLERGDAILEIDGLPIETIERKNLWETVLPNAELHTPISMSVQKADGTIKIVDLENAWVTQDTVLYHDVISAAQLKIGYLVFDTFSERARDDLLAVFDDFSKAGVDELIVDLRYNPGGEGTIAQLLASLIAGQPVEEKLFSQTRHNAPFQDWDREYFFYDLENALDLDRVVFITAEGTCSASELLIQGLSPYIDVVLIGDTTCGKPVGMHTYEFGDQVINYVESKVANADNTGDYFNGLQPDCLAKDDATHLLGDTQESSLAEAIYYIVNSKCSSVQGSPLPHQSQSHLSGFRREIGSF